MLSVVLVSGKAVLLLFVEMLWPERKRERVAKKESADAPTAAGLKPVGTGAGEVTRVAVLLGLFSWSLAASASTATALKNYREGKFDEALKEYQQAIEKRKDDLRLHFNAGTVAYRMTNYTAAAQYFTTAATAPDLKLQQSAYYNLGNTQFRMGETTEDLDALITQWETAAKSYQSAVTLDKNDRDAAHNLEFVKFAVEQVKQMREAARRAREDADQSLRRRNYHRALEIMESLIQQNIAAKPFQEFTKKLKDIDAIANPPQVQPQP